MNEQFSSEYDYDYQPGGTVRESDRIRHDIDRTLYEMSDTVDQIQERLQPRALLNQARSAIMSPAGVIGLGVAWLMIDRLTGRGRHEFYEVGRRVRRDVEWAPQRWGGRRRTVAQRAAHAREAVGSMAEQAKERVADISSRAGDAVHSARGRASDKKDSIREQLSHATRKTGVRVAKAGRAVKRSAQYARDQAYDVYDDNPLAVGAAALAAGIVGGLLLPSTQREDELLGSSRDDLLDKAKGVGREVIETGKEAIRSAAQSASGEVRGGQSVAQKAASAIGRGLQAAGEEVRKRSDLGPGAAHNLD
jgi:ElaB/YqjD/DUF883 family membrane-anchored ribosome-binding protein